jgi:hypothetical protein
VGGITGRANPAGAVPTISELDVDPGVTVRMACPFASSPVRSCFDTGTTVDARLSCAKCGRGPYPIQSEVRTTDATARPALRNSVDRINLTPSLAGSLVPHRHGTFGASGVDGYHRVWRDPHNCSEIEQRNAPRAVGPSVAPIPEVVA